MIRTSTWIAALALAVSLAVHLFGVSLLTRVPSDQTEGEAEPGDTSIGTTFEDIAQTSQPVETEPAPTPEPPVETAAEPPPPAERDTTMALVEAANPEPSASPGTGAAPAAPVEATPPVEPEPVGVPEPDTAERPDIVGAETPETESAESSDTPQAVEALQPERAAAAPVQPETATAVAPPAETESVAEEIAALPPEIAPALEVTPSDAPDAIPLIVEEPEAAEPVPSEEVAEPVQEAESPQSETDGSGGTALAVAASPRPPGRSSPQPAASNSRFGGTPPPILFPESPLVAYARNGNLNDWGSTVGSGTSGNADVTNYAGQVLVHLNQTPGRRTSGRANARVMFEINRDGSLAWVEIIQSTGTFEFDQAAKDQVRNAAPFPRPPEGARRQFSFVYRSKQ